MKRRHFLQGIAAIGLGMALDAHAALPVIDVYKSASCGCCTGWVEHLRANGFTVKAHDVPNPSDYREKFGIPQAFGSCHTGRVEGYALEGHVPAREVKRLLTERPKAKGLAVPGMAVGSPGMEVEGQDNDAYDVLLVQENGQHLIYNHYNAKTAPDKVQANLVETSTTDGEIKKVDKRAGEITIKHGPIANLGMPGMTMAFLAKESAMLGQVKAGDKIKFAADKVSGTYIVTKIDVIK